MENAIDRDTSLQKLSAQRSAPPAESALGTNAEDTARTAVRRKWRIGTARYRGPEKIFEWNRAFLHLKLPFSGGLGFFVCKKEVPAYHLRLS
ncbi:MAG: hypothetical protein IJA86_04910 [Clostridia bacterium]|nr:hypothetical protein [Clostridia bacterium]